MSLRYRMAMELVRLSGMKKLFQLPQDELLRKAEQLNRRRQFRMPTDGKARYADQRIEGSHCLVMETQPRKSARALLFLFGGGMILGSDAGDLKVARDVGRRSGRDVWFPHYPLCTDHCIRDSVKMVYESYRQMLEEYRPEDIAVLGFSSGAGLALGMCGYNNMQREKLPMPSMIVACSPGNCPADEREYRQMAALNDRDLLVDVVFMDRIRLIMEHGEPDVPKELISFALGDYSGAPLTYFYYGGDEVLSASAEAFSAAFARAGARCSVHIEPGMCHCYPMLTFFPEGRRAYEEIVALLS